jgi:hypothetical protein
MTEQAASEARCYFLSYSRSDERFALRLARDLREQGVAMWVDQLDIRPSEHWDRAIERAVRACCGLVVILSPRSVVSDNVADEISFAIDSGKSVLPVMIEKCVLPLRITRMHLIDATGSYDKALRQCLAELKEPTGRPSAPSESIAEPSAPLDPQLLSSAREQLTAILGPIAAILVDKTASRAASAKELYGLLAPHIDSEEDRERFLATLPSDRPAPAAPRPASSESIDVPPQISPAELDALGEALTAYLGPIAPIVARRESRACSSLEDLRQRLAALIPTEPDRSAFLNRATAR